MGLSNSEFAALVGCHVTTASRWRNGHRLPEVVYLERIRDALGLEWDDVYSRWEAGRKWAAKHPKSRYPDRARNPFGKFLRKYVFDETSELVSS